MPVKKAAAKPAPKKAEPKKAAAKPAPKKEAKPAPKKAEPKKAAPSANASYHLSKREDGKWQLFITGSDKVIKTFATKAEGEAYAKEKAANTGRAVNIKIAAKNPHNKPLNISLFMFQHLSIPQSQHFHTLKNIMETDSFMIVSAVLIL